MSFILLKALLPQASPVPAQSLNTEMSYIIMMYGASVGGLHCSTFFLSGAKTDNYLLKQENE